MSLLKFLKITLQKYFQNFSKNHHSISCNQLKYFVSLQNIQQTSKKLPHLANFTL